MLEFMSMLVVMFVAFAVVLKITSRIPKTGRYSVPRGIEIEAEILNENHTAEEAVTMKLVDSNGRKYRVKLKDSESKMWIKGDKVKVLLSEKNSEYRVLYNDYFRENEERLKKNAVEVIGKKIGDFSIAAYLTGYKKDSLEAILSSEADSLTVFIFYTYMKRIRAFSILSFVMTVAFLVWCRLSFPPLSQMIAPLIFLIFTYCIIYSTVIACKKMLAKFTK